MILYILQIYYTSVNCVLSGDLSSSIICELYSLWRYFCADLQFYPSAMLWLLILRNKFSFFGGVFFILSYMTVCKLVHNLEWEVTLAHRT